MGFRETGLEVKPRYCCDLARSVCSYTQLMVDLEGCLDCDLAGDVFSIAGDASSFATDQEFDGYNQALEDVFVNQIYHLTGTVRSNPTLSLCFSAIY